MFRRSSNHRNEIRETYVPPLTAASGNARFESLRHSNWRNKQKECKYDSLRLYLLPSPWRNADRQQI